MSPAGAAATAARTSVGVVITSEHTGGAEQYLLDLYGQLGSRGVRSTLLGELRGWDRTGFPQLPLGLSGKWSRRGLLRSAARTPVELGGAVARIRKAHATGRFDRFHAQFKREQILLTPALARMAPVVWTEHGRFTTFRGSTALRRAYGLAARSVETIICVSDEVASEVATIVGPHVTIEVIENAVDGTIFRPATGERELEERRRLRASLDVADGEPLAVVASRLHPAKDLGRALDAARAGKLRLVVAGDGPDAARLQELAGDTTTFVGHRSKAQVADLLRAADLFFYCPQATEGSPLSVLEAAASGLALVALAPPPGDPGSRSVVEAGGVVLAAPDAIADWLPTLDLAACRIRALAFAATRSVDQWAERHRAVLAGR